VDGFAGAQPGAAALQGDRLADVASMGNARAELDREVEIFDDVLAGGFASMQCAPGRIVGKGQDVRFERVDRLAVGDAEQPVFHSDFLKGALWDELSPGRKE
jgi:hypothetical protein